MVRLGALLLTASTAAAQERVITTCYAGIEERQVVISERDGTGFWTEGDRRVEAQMIRSIDSDEILGITANRLDGSISMLSLSRPTAPPVPRRRAAALTVHQIIDGDIVSETLDTYCDVEPPR